MFQITSRKSSYFIAITALVALIAWANVLHQHGSNMSVTFVDVGQGDSTVIKTPSGNIILIDGGGVPATDDSSFDVGEKILIPYLRGQGINRVDLVVASHPHDDHVSGLVSVLKRIRVKSVLDSGASHPSGRYLEFLEQVDKRKIPYHIGRRGMKIKLDDSVVLDVLHPEKFEKFDSLNDSSLVLRIRYGKVSFLFPGDCGMEAEEDMCNEGTRLNSTVLKVGHHGSANSTGDVWLTQVHPRASVISVGRNNLFGHPSPHTLRRLKRSGVRIYRTDEDGAVRFNTDGRTLQVRTFRHIR